MRVAKNKKYVLIAAGMFVLGFMIGYGSITLKFSTSMSDDAIRNKFGCYRVTLDVRETDVFCNPALYRNPYLSEDDYYVRKNCESVLKASPSADDRAKDALLAKVYDTCANKILLNQERIEFNNNIRILRLKN